MEVPLVNHAVKCVSTSTEEYRGAVHKNFLQSVTDCPAYGDPGLLLRLMLLLPTTLPCISLS